MLTAPGPESLVAHATSNAASAAAIPQCSLFVIVASRSIHARTGRLDDRRPLRQLGLDECRELFRRTARRRIDAGILQPLQHGWILQRLVDRGAEPPRDRRRRLPRREDRVPGVALVS